MLKITKASDPIEVSTLVGTLYAVPGVGKTSMAFTAEKPLLLDFDRGSYRAANRGDVVQVETWNDVMNITAEDLKPYKTLIVDTAGRALDVLGAHIMKLNPKAMKRSGGMSLEGFGDMKNSFITWTKLIRSFGLDIILIAHSDEQKDGDDLRERLDITGGSKNEIYKASDFMGRIYLQNGKRVLNFSPSDTAFGKNPGQLQPLEVPDYTGGSNFLATVLTSIKKALNQQSREQVATAGLLDEWKSAINDLADPEDFNAILPAVKEIDASVRDNVKRLLMKHAKAVGLTFDKKAGAFVAVEAAA